MKDLKQKVDELFQDKKMSVYEASKILQVSEFDILNLKDENEFKLVSGDKFLEIIEDLGSWGEVVFIKNTPEFIIEIKLKIDTPKQARGFYNFNGNSGFLGGHLKEDAIANIGFVSTKFMGFLGHSLHFYDKNNNSIFKIFVSRDEKMQLNKTQEEKFFRLKNRF
ncbi:putative heme iron utilization protein, ChuX/HutX family [Campylobacter blaseri]|uniref:Heme utilization cystosolic carrier protein HutX n=1 Tax=Campylobacter blaseri TaxID=2042961 RepID=A0A2P8R430_9BACT|nr:heme utilization cystosolic carrier protein HutX [Campylobacter blaseri]PSM53233.1 heme utilization cystosolic carrier protein HutX [Campylobacter blaseri]PSM54699.1 heme utilization cystosolic carrier protein HutX [Campylobacter blaseri]QKF86818.1 putative heme iron utilization protein, ChuX/HutX family [Campylobacter blaseri]